MKRGRSWMLLFLVTAVLVTAGVLTRQTKAATFTDDFSSGINPDHWTVTNGIYTIDDTHGDIRISKGAGGTGAPGEWARIEFNRTVYGDFDVSVEYSGAVLGGCQNQVQLNLTFGGQHVCNRRENWCGSRYSVWLDPPASTVGATGTSDTSGILRVTRVGTTVTFYANATQIYQANFNNLPVTHLSLSLQNNGTSDAISVIFDNFSLTADSIEGVCTPPPSGMVSWWGGDDNAYDIVGTNHGALSNGATFAAGKVGQAFSFDGIDDYVEMTGSSIGDFGSSPFTIDFWMYANNTGNSAYIMGKSHPDGGQGWDIRLHNGKIRLEGTDGWHPVYNWESNTSVSPSTWHHIAISATTDSISVYINGTLDGTTSRSAISSTANPFRLGFTTNYGGTPFNGLIDEVEIFNRALTAGEIAAIYNAGSAGKCRPCTPPPSNMVSWWKAEDNANDSYGTNHGTMMNGATFAAGMVGQAFSFDGVDDYVDIPSIINNRSQGTIEAWVKFNSDLFEPIGKQIFSATMGEPLDGKYDVMLLGVSPFTGESDIRFGIFQTSWEWAASGVTPTPGQWYHVVATWGSEGMKLYVNGELLGVHTYTGTSGASTYNIIGASSWPGTAFNGSIDEVQIYNRALTAQEIAAIYNAGSAGMCPIQKYNLAVTKDGTGSGTVTSDPSGINCGGTCSADFNEGTDVTLTATPEVDSTFAGWGGDCNACGTNTTCNITMDEDKACSARFDLSMEEQHNLTVTRDGTGSGTVMSSPAGINCGETCNADFNEGTDVTLTATPDAGSTFAGWGGNCASCGTNSACIVTMDADRVCVAVFDLNQYNLALNKTGTGSGTVTSSPAGIDCGQTCDADFNEGTGVNLTAIPDSGSRFVSWGDDCSSCGTETTCNITIDEDKACSATFDLSPVSGPDLVVSSLTAPESARPGGLIRVMNSVTNQGTQKAGRSKVGFYLSANNDPTIGPEDLFMGSRSVPPPAGPRKLAPGKTSSTKKRLRIPSDTVAGTYYVKAKADYQDVVQETDETNNILVSGEINIQ